MRHEVDGVWLNVMDEGQGLPILFLHGLGGCWRDWEAQLDLLSDRFRCIAVDHRGHGRSDLTDATLSTELFAHDALAVCAMLGVDHAYVVGLSMGGMVAQKLVLAAPGFVDALVLADTGARMPDVMSEALVAMADAVRANGFPSSHGVVPPESPAWSPYTIEHHPNVVRNNMRDAESADREAWARAAIAVTEHNTVDALPQIKAPTLLVWGEHDEVVRIGAAKPLQKGIGHAKLVVIPDAGHLCNLEQPEAFNQTIVDFFAAS